MSQASGHLGDLPLAAPSVTGRSAVRELLRFARNKPLGAASAVVILVFLLMAASPSTFATHDPDAQDTASSLQNVSSAHLFGTDNFGRDVYSRVVYGARTSLYIGFGAVVVGLAVATAVGVVSAYAGGWIDSIIQRFVDAIMALPWLVLLMSMMALLGPGTTNTLLVVGLLTAPGTSRVIRGSVLRIKENQYIEAARATGCSTPRVMFRYVIPNIVPEMIILASIGIGAAIIAESSLSFLGFGVVPPQASWGYMLGIEGRRFQIVAPWLSIFPGAAIALCVFAFNMLGDALRDVLDPRLRSR
ncbi:MAG: ABC transporter permease [Hyphomicrobiales bacterium]